MLLAFDWIRYYLLVSHTVSHNIPTHKPIIPLPPIPAPHAQRYNHMQSWEKAAETLSEYIHNETGIHIDEVDFTFITEGDTLSVKLNNYDFSVIEYSEDDFKDRNVCIEILESVGHVKKRLVEIKVSELMDFLPELTENIKFKLQNKNIPPEIISILEFQILDMGYLPPIQVMEGEEVTSEYPDIVLTITNPHGLNYPYLLNIYNPDTPVDDIDDLIAGLLGNITAI